MHAPRSPLSFSTHTRASQTCNETSDYNENERWMQRAIRQDKTSGQSQLKKQEDADDGDDDDDGGKKCRVKIE